MTLPSENLKPAIVIVPLAGVVGLLPPHATATARAATSMANNHPNLGMRYGKSSSLTRTASGSHPVQVQILPPTPSGPVDDLGAAGDPRPAGPRPPLPDRA